MAGDHYRIDMTEGKLLPKILLFSLPLIASGVLQLLFNAADIIVVGKFDGHESLAAVSSTGALINLIVNIFIGLSIGANVVVARHIGADEQEEISKTVHTAMMLSIIGGVILTVFGIAAAHPMLEWMDTPDNVIDLAVLYLRIYFLGITASLIYNYGASILRAKGDTKRPLYYLALAGVVNIILNLILVIVFHLGVAGVGIATVVSQIISATLVFICLTHERGGLQLHPKEMHIDFRKFIDILKIGLPAGIQGCVFSLSNVVIQASVNSFGSTIMAGNGAAQNIEGFVYTGMNAFYQSCLTFTSQNMGARSLDRIKQTLFSCQLLVIITGLILGIGAWYFGDLLLSIYSDDPAVIAAGIVRLGYVSKTYFLCGIMDVMVGSLRGLGYSIFPMIVSLVGACGLRILWLATVFNLYHTIEMVYISYPVSWIITALAHMITFIFVFRKVSHKIKLDESLAN
ncbi:MATE family efflux transporter [uncultured Traorella sp.]|uniref:MATE family efflux transporter n=1 Tax=uncultured Traorella sp. TaxID=1929048 RepID=UPI0025D515CF|nr:MATE family efflux transporter [uncultured Traorella sp.]